MTGETEAKPVFRVHFHDGTSLDVRAANSLIAEKDARKKRPGDYIRKIKLVRDPSCTLSADTSASVTKGHADE